MWWHILPSAAIITTLLAVPQYTCYFYNKIAFGNPFKRNLESVFHRSMFTRDGRLTGAVWILNDLESIPDD